MKTTGEYKYVLCVYGANKELCRRSSAIMHQASGSIKGICITVF